MRNLVLPFFFLSNTKNFIFLLKAHNKIAYFIKRGTYIYTILLKSSQITHGTGENVVFLFSGGGYFFVRGHEGGPSWGICCRM